MEEGGKDLYRLVITYNSLDGTVTQAVYETADPGVGGNSVDGKAANLSIGETETEVTEPESEEAEPETEVTEPESEEAEPETGVTEPESEETEPETEVTEPESEEAEPETEVTEPESEEAEPETGVTEPETEGVTSETEITGSETQEAVLEVVQTNRAAWVTSPEEVTPENEQVIPEDKVLGAPGDDVTADCLEEVPRISTVVGDEDADLIEFFSVAGDEVLTGYNWLGVDGDTEEYKQQAAAAGRMNYNDLTGKYEKTWFDVPLGGNETYSYSFKIVANGSWDYGVNYGIDGSNYILMLQNENAAQCNVTISFDPGTGEIGVTTDPVDTIVTADEAAFRWYVAAAYNLVSNDAYTAAATTYDTVRDITAAFDFTADADLSWAVDERRNEEEDYYGNFAGGDSFTIPYEVAGKTVEGSFGGEVLTFEETEENGVTAYRVTDFMPGKNWVQVVSGTEAEREAGFGGMRRIRLLPTAYVEAGTNASVSAVYDGGTSDWLN